MRAVGAVAVAHEAAARYRNMCRFAHGLQSRRDRSARERYRSIRSPDRLTLGHAHRAALDRNGSNAAAAYRAAAERAVHGACTVHRTGAEREGRARAGGASSFLADRVEEEGEVRVFIEHNDNFRLPANPETPVIMIGPGTGIAPFRAFMQQRAADEAPGKNWLFFGNPHFTEDFLYQVEWQRYVKEGVLTRIDLAWSRDQKEKVYVQDKLREQGAELWRWINDGAHIYVCGDANRMAKDVEQALLEVIAEFGGMDTEAADEFLSELRVERRYQRDVY